jgi:RNA polymerase sigma-70 factor, ECF subfamily
LTDADLLRCIQQGDSAAWRAFHTSELPAVWRYAYALVGDRSVAEDIAGEAMLAMLRSLDQFDPDHCQIRAWLRGVVANKAADHFRRLSRRRKMLDVVRSVAGSGGMATAAGPSRPMEIEETRRRVLEVLDRLPEAQRLSLEWKYVDGLSVCQIADRLGQSEKAVESLLFRARRTFRRLHQTHELSKLIMTEREKPREGTRGGRR